MQNDSIFVYGKNNCGQCNIIKNKLTNMNIPFQYVCDEDVALQKARELQEKDQLIELTMPIIIKGDRQISHAQINSLLN